MRGPLRFERRQHVLDFQANLGGASVFSKIDLIRDYHQIPMAAQDVPKIAVVTPFVLFGAMWVPFGKRNAAQIFQIFIGSVLRDLPFIYSYIGHILLGIKCQEEHAEHLRILFKRLQDAGNSLVLTSIVIFYHPAVNTCTHLSCTYHHPQARQLHHPVALRGTCGVRKDLRKHRLRHVRHGGRIEHRPWRGAPAGCFFVLAPYRIVSEETEAR